jgi:uncharacterized membrane protein
MTRNRRQLDYAEANDIRSVLAFFRGSTIATRSRQTIMPTDTTGTPHPWRRLMGRFAPSVRTSVPAIFLLVTFLLTGVTFIAITPPGQNSDESDHFFRAYQVSQGNVLSDETVQGPREENGRKIGGLVPAQAAAFIDSIGVLRGFDATSKFDDLDYAHLQSFRDDGTETFRQFVNAAAYPPLAYVPTAAAWWVGDVLNLSFLSILYLGRVFCLLATAALLAVTIRILPVGRWAFIVLALLPATVGQAAAFSADGMTIALGFVSTAYVARVALQDTHVRWTQWLILSLLFIAVALVKPSYAPMVALVLIIPVLNRYARSRIAAIGAVTTITVAGLATLGWARLIGYIDYGVNPKNNVAVQTELLLENPFRFVRAAINLFIFDGPNGLTDQKGDFFRGIFGDFAWLSTPVPMLFMIALVVALVLSTLVIDDHELPAIAQLQQSRWWRVVLVGVTILTTLGVAGSLYLYFTPTAGTTVQGLQGRYMLPVLLAGLLACVGNRLVSQRGVRTAVASVSVISLGVSLVALSARFYTLPLEIGG